MQEDGIESAAQMRHGGGRPPRNPVWIREETILLLDLYLRVGRAPPGNAEVCLLSDRLIRLAQRSGHVVGATYRNPEGVAMKLKAMAQQDPEFRATGRKGLRAVRIDAAVWRDLAEDRDGLAVEVEVEVEVERILTGIPMADATAGPPVSADRRTTRSRGPVPSFGTISMDRRDSDCVVYALRFEGPLAALFAPGRVPNGWIVAKLGRTNEIERRIVELSAGLPPEARLGWTILETARFATAGAAQAAEQALLVSAETKGWTLGGEFVIAPEAALLQELRAFADPQVSEAFA